MGQNLETGNAMNQGPRWDWAEPHSKPFIGGNGYPVRDHPTIYRCPAVLASGNKCPAYLNHDGDGYLYCTDEADHAAALPDGCVDGHSPSRVGCELGLNWP